MKNNTGLKFKRFSEKGWGFVAMIFGYEISYAHFAENIGISWRRAITVGNRRWYLREDWSRFAKSNKGKVKWYLNPPETSHITKSW